MIYTFFLVVLLLAVSIILLGVKTFFTKDGQFPNTHVGGNLALNSKGIFCAKFQDKQERNKKTLFERSMLNENNNEQTNSSL
ncbi:hypothetical protein AwDysgo_04350 [Bacteroidales bacterium]|nr:hypothetical protein AwDysgo_04350 [Bacteroidales bacterium]